MKKVIRKKILQYAAMVLAGVLLYILPPLIFESGAPVIRILHKTDVVYLIVVLIMILNSALVLFLELYSSTDKNRNHPLKGLVQALQVILYFVGGIVIVAVIIDKSPAALLTGLGASAAVLTLIFKDSILGFVAGYQLSRNNMIRLGDWIQMPDGSANGTVEEITLNTVKVRNWDNTLTMVPPYTLVTTPFKNWRGMQESGGRRADKCIFVDMMTMAICDAEMIGRIGRDIPLMDSYLKALPNWNGGPDKGSAGDGGKMPDAGGWSAGDEGPAIYRGGLGVTNVQLYRTYIELYLRACPEVNTSLDLIITQKEATPYGLPIQIYFFTREKAWAVYEKQQSDIFDHIMTMAPSFGLRLYQRP